MKMSKKKSVGWLSTGNGEGSLGLLKKGLELVNAVSYTHLTLPTKA